MRSGGVEPIREAAAAPGPVGQKRSVGRVAGLAAAVVLAAVAGYFMLGRRPQAGEQSDLIAPSTPSELRSALGAAHEAAGPLASLLEPDPRITEFAERAAGSASSPIAKAEAVVAALRGRASALAFVPWSLGEPRGSDVMPAREVLPVLQKDKGRAELYPLEVVAVAVAALRALHVPALVAELYDLPGATAPLDPSGFLGYFGVAVYPETVGEGAPRVFDPYGGRELPSDAKHELLRDTQVVGAALALRALHEVAYLADPRAALESSSHALALAGRLPSVRTVRGMVVIAGRQLEQGLQEFAAARQLRSDAARLHNVATAELMSGDLERANKDLQAALAKTPEFAGARATLGTLSLLSGEPERALSELTQAEKLAPDLALVQWALADYWMRAGERERALEVARRTAEKRPSFDAGLRLGMLLRQAGRYDEMRSEAQKVLERAPAYRKEEVRELIRDALGPTALDEVDEPGGAASLAEDLELDLGKGAASLRDDRGPSLPALSDPTSDDSRGPRLRLGGDEDLRLRLGR